MKNVSSLKANKIESPKTPGGISKALLTPCRRVGLSRNWRKSGPSPFISPLAGNAEVNIEKRDETPKRDTRKRKERCDDVAVAESTPESKGHSQDHNELPRASTSEDIETTPSRNVSIPRRKKSKTHLSSRIENNDVESPKLAICINDVVQNDICKESKGEEKDFECKISVDTPVLNKFKSKVKATELSDSQIERKENINSNSSIKDSNVEEKTKETRDIIVKDKVKQKSPENLTKECIVVIQKKLYKKDLERIKQKDRNRTVEDEWEIKKPIVNPVSQALFDSDTDDVPLSALNKVESKQIQVLDDDDDFTDTKKIKVKKLEDKTTSIGGLKSESSKKKSKQKKDKQNRRDSKHVEPKLIEFKPSSQSSIDDDDEDFVMDKKRTILIKKSYDKVSKPLKSKSTGSITQKDIDDLKAKIEMKKKLLLAKAVTQDTEELRDLIKKWQKGCQDALMELMELMRNKFPDKQNMDYSEILQTLKIPASLVGYDEENDCFGTPTDENIVLSKFNDT